MLAEPIIFVQALITFKTKHNSAMSSYLLPWPAPFCPGRSTAEDIGWGWMRISKSLRRLVQTRWRCRLKQLRGCPWSLRGCHWSLRPNRLRRSLRIASRLGRRASRLGRLQRASRLRRLWRASRLGRLRRRIQTWRWLGNHCCLGRRRCGCRDRLPRLHVWWPELRRRLCRTNNLLGDLVPRLG